MLFIILLAVLVVLITYVVVRWMTIRQYWAKRGIPYVPPNPFTGSFTFLFRENAALWFRRVYNTYKMPYVGIWVFWRPGLLVNSPDVAKNILIRDQANFRNRFATSGNADPLGRLNLFTLDDPLWTVIRRKLSILFTSSKLKGVDILITEKSKDLVERIEKDRQSPTPIDTRNLMTDYATDIIGTSSFGIVSNATLTGKSEIKTITQVLMHFDLVRGLAWCCGFFIPELAHLLRLKLFPQNSIDHMRRILRTMIAHRGGLENKVTEPRDLLDILIKIKQENSEELDMSENMMLAQASVFVQGGFDTTATALTFIIYELAFHPEIQERLYNELKEAKDKPSEDTFDDLAELTYLNCVISEGLRKYPIIGYLDRVALEDYKVDDQLTIQAGTPVYVNLVGIHYDPEFYPDPQKFDPDRFLPENRSHKSLTFLAFGDENVLTVPRPNMLLLTAVVFLITYLVLRWIQLKQYWKKLEVPYIPPHPVFGSFTFLQRENIAVWMRRMYEQFKEPYVGLWIFWRPGLLVNSENIARNILIRDQANFRNRLIRPGTTDPVGYLNLFTVDDPIWTMLRKRLSILFTSSKLRSIQNTLTLKSKELVQRIDKDRQKCKPINLKALMIDFSTDITATSTFGIESDATLTGESYFRTITQGYTQFKLFRALTWICIFFIPDLIDILRLKMFPTENNEYLRKLLRIMIAKRGGLENKVTEPRDLLDILIKINQEGDKELNMTENMMLAQCVAFVVGGYETSAMVLTFGIYELAFHPDVQNKLYEELQEAKNEHGDDLLDAGVLSQLTYLNCVVDETLRKYPFLSWLDRVALKNYKVDENLTIKAGTPIMVNVIGLHYDPEIYPEPDKFNPDRFLEKSDVKHFAFMPFGEGPRKCVGQRLGYSTVRHVMTTIILNYEVRPLPKYPRPEEMKLNKNTLHLTPGDMLSVEFVPRN